MNYVDRIIDYLEGIMSSEEAEAFLAEVKTNEKLNAEFREVSMANELIREQLRKNNEKEFRKLLKEAMERTDSGRRSGFRGPIRPWRILVPAAASIALIVSLLLINQSQERLLAKFFHPDKDPLVLASQQSTRGPEAYGIALYSEGKYRECTEHMLLLVEEDPGQKLACLYYLLSFLKSDLPADSFRFCPGDTGQGTSAVVPGDSAVDPGTSAVDSGVSALDAALSWYTALSLVKTGQREKATDVLKTLAAYENPYRRNAKKLKKFLLK